jgi:hypothetical protein
MGSNAMPNCEMNGTSVAIGSNHGHTLVVSKEDVAAGVDKSYDITGTSDHPHTVMITAAQFAMLEQNTSITTVSSTDDLHSHSIKVSCA